MEVQWDNMYQPSTSTSTIPSTLPLRTDVIIELRENSTERFLLPLDGASIERISDGGRTFILLSLLLDIPQTESIPADAFKTCAKQPVNFKLFQGTTSIWEGLERRINATSPARRSQLKEEFEGVVRVRLLSKAVSDMSARRWPINRTECFLRIDFRLVVCSAR